MGVLCLERNNLQDFYRTFLCVQCGLYYMSRSFLSKECVIMKFRLWNWDKQCYWFKAILQFVFFIFSFVCFVSFLAVLSDIVAQFIFVLNNIEMLLTIGGLLYIIWSNKADNNYPCIPKVIHKIMELEYLRMSRPQYFLLCFPLVSVQ